MAAFLVVASVVFQIVVTSRSIYLSRLRWDWELLLTTVYLSKFVAPVALLAGYFAWRGIRLTKRRPDEYGGPKLCHVSFALAVLIVVGNVAAVIARIPAMLENRRIKQMAYTRAKMYQLNEAITKYRQQFGIYPRQLIDLQEMDPNLGPILDYWDHEFIYTPMSAEIASRGMPVPFQNCQVVSRGTDGILGTADDIAMIDGVIVQPASAQHEELIQPQPARSQPRPAKSRRHRPNVQKNLNR